MSSSFPVPNGEVPSTGAKTLQELCAERALEQLQQDENAVATFNNLGEDYQQILFAHLWKDYTRLLELEKTAILGWPAADRDLYTNTFGDQYRTIYLDYPDIFDWQRGTEMGPGGQIHEISHYFRSRWRQPLPFYLAPPNLNQGITPNDGRKWNTKNLFMSPGPGRRVMLCPCWLSNICAACRAREMDDFFDNSCSSQLLLYRLTVVFGLCTTTEVMYHPDTPCWTFKLQSREYPETTLRLEDFLGRFDVCFRGSQRASASALVLLNFLISNEVPHRDEYVFLAGRTL
jgi:hypothetical protein